MTTRDDMLERIRKCQPAATPLPDIPVFDNVATPMLERFRAGVERMGGKVVEAAGGADLGALVRSLYPEAKVICSACVEVKGTRRPDPKRPPAELDDVDVGVVRALFGVAETGSVWVTDAQFGVSALGFLSQHLVVLLDPKLVVGNLHDAYRQRGQFEVGYGVLMTGPSATADIEGVLIHGAQGIRSLTVVMSPAQ